MRDAIVAATEQSATRDMAAVAMDEVGDTIYAIDRISEEQLIEAFESEVAPLAPMLLIAEGLPNDGQVVLPRGTDAADVQWRVLVDPIDGTRGLMYQKRSAWVLTGVAPNRGDATSLCDITFAVQTEVPLVKQYLSDQVWAVRGQGVQAQRHNRITGERTRLALQPSRSTSIGHGFATVARFFPGAREVLAAIDDEVAAAVLGPVLPGKAACFEDQYISTGGQLYELMVGHDRYVADLRPLTEAMLAARGAALGLCCHPYDLCTALIAEELGVVLTAPNGGPLNAPLAVAPDVGWVGYANPAIQSVVQPALQRALVRRRLLEV
ncbi:MAG: inositol monophosphatase [Anaerolineae bacterium]|jgi:fructose-1,6-bisphosphatase/inositol monophosphatase family enzyme|nr:inositol monophosphatase [Anaerolineae bacterium]